MFADSVAKVAPLFNRDLGAVPQWMKLILRITSPEIFRKSNPELFPIQNILALLGPVDSIVNIGNSSVRLVTDYSCYISNH